VTALCPTWAPSRSISYHLRGYQEGIPTPLQSPPIDSRRNRSGGSHQTEIVAHFLTETDTLEKEQKQYTLDRFLRQLEKTDLLICDELGYVSFSRNGVELLFRVFTNRYERSSLLLTSNLAFSDWNQVFQGERMTAALLDRLTHRCHIFEMNGESYRFRESMKAKKGRKGE
jgi:hypothetical protein